MRSLHFQRLLGSGAVGSVYLADLSAGQGFRRQVAVKVLQKDQAHGDLFMSRVRDEARLLGLLADDHILKVLELARIDGRDAVIMEYVEGTDLAAIVEAGQRPPPRALAELGAAVAGALHRAHRAVHPTTGEALNVIHRDVKPANVMLTSRGSVKLLDFGVARARFESRESFTGQFVLGTLNYMAPEYIVTGEVSPAADIYGLALTLWEAACGEVFGQPKLREDLHRARVEERLEVISGTHAELVPVLRQMLQWDPRSRPDGAAVERQFIAAMDMLRGTGLRSWAGEVVPTALARERASARDEVGLLGKTVPLGEASAPLVDTPPAPPPRAEADADATVHSADRAPFLGPSATPTATSAPARAPDAPARTPATPAKSSAPDLAKPASVPARPASAAPSRAPGPASSAAKPSPARPGAASPAARPRPKGSSTGMLLLQVGLVGGLFCFILVGLVACVLLLQHFR